MPPYESRLTLYREQTGLSRDALAQLVGVSRQTIANIEAGRHEPGVLVGMALASVLGVSVHDLFRPQPQQGVSSRMNRYRFQAARGVFHNPYAPIPAFTAEAIAGALPGAAVRALMQLPLDQGYDVELQLQRNSHEDALDEIASVLGTFGLQLVQARIAEVVTAAVESAIAGGAGGAAIGSSTRDPGVTLAGALIGLAVGAAVGSQIERVAAAYLVARPHPMAPWLLTPIALRGPDASGAPAS